MNIFELLDFEESVNSSKIFCYYLEKTTWRFRRQFIMEMEMRTWVVKVIVIKHKVHDLMVGGY